MRVRHLELRQDGVTLILSKKPKCDAFRTLAGRRAIEIILKGTEQCYLQRMRPDVLSDKIEWSGYLVMTIYHARR
jgi:hypothetical protein